METLKQIVRTVPNFPIPGIPFKDVTTLLKDAGASRQAVDLLAEESADSKIDLVAGIEARGFLFAPILAYRLNAGVVPLRKPGKLPAETRKVQFELEYGSDALEIHTDAIQPGNRVLVADDLLATGGTAEAACHLVENAGGIVAGVAFLIELSYLRGRDRLTGRPVFALLDYPVEDPV